LYLSDTTTGTRNCSASNSNALSQENKTEPNGTKKPKINRQEENQYEDANLSGSASPLSVLSFYIYALFSP